MGQGPDLTKSVSRRGVLAGAATLVGAAAQGAEDALLQSLIRQNQRTEFGHGFNATSRTIVMPKASLPTMSPATIEHTERAIVQYEEIMAKGGWRWANVSRTSGVECAPRAPIIRRSPISFWHSTCARRSTS